ncbi:MAG: hypothetical protein ACFFAN_07070 [Promethearchaeota archaeon]
MIHIINGTDQVKMFSTGIYETICALPFYPPHLTHSAIKLYEGSSLKRNAPPSLVFVKRIKNPLKKSTFFLSALAGFERGVNNHRSIRWRSAYALLFIISIPKFFLIWQRTVFPS